MRSALGKVNGIDSIEVGPIEKESKSAVVVIKGTMKADDVRAAFAGTQYSATLQ